MRNRGSMESGMNMSEQIPVLNDFGVRALAAGGLGLKGLPGFARCPRCGKLFAPEHAARKPQYCEDCGVGLRWD